MKKLFSVSLLHITYHILHPVAPVFAQGPERWSLGHCYKEVTVDSQVIEVATLQGFECIFINLVRILVPLVGLAFFIMLIMGSFKFMTAGGEPKKLEQARKAITSALFGLVAFFGIWFILLLIRTITGVNVTKFEMPGPN